jgi:hypothetical protein
MVENALVFASIIVGLAVSEMLFSFNRLLLARKQVRWDWVPLLLALIILMYVVLNWWMLAGMRARSLTLAAFLPSLVQLILVFLLAAAALPRQVPEAGVDLHDHYRERAPYIWTLFALSVVWMMLRSGAELVAAGAGPFRFVDNLALDAVVAGLMIWLIFSRSRPVHIGVLGLLALLLLWYWAPRVIT